MDYGVALGRRFRALKLWFVLRNYGAEGLREMLRSHIALARGLAEQIDAEPDWERLAPTRFSVVVFRYRPRDIADEALLERANMQVLHEVNASGEVFLSHTKVRGRYALRVAIGNQHTAERHVGRAWELLRDAARRTAIL
jgi:aromatic-L-amino-acid decarboxylase